jgi:hypothetical protein
LVWYARRTKDGHLFSQGVAGEKLEAVIPMNGTFMSGVLDRHDASSALHRGSESRTRGRVRLVLFDPERPPSRTSTSFVIWSAAARRRCTMRI